MDEEEQTVDLTKIDPIERLSMVGSTEEVEKLEACLAWKALERFLYEKMQVAKNLLEQSFEVRTATGSDMRSDEFLRAEIFVIRHLLTVKEVMKAKEGPDDER